VGVWGRCPQKLKYNVKFRPLRNRLTTRFCRVLCIVCTILRYCWNIQIQGLFKDFQGPGIFFKIQGFLKDPMNPVCGSCLSTNTDKYTGSSETLFCLVFITDRRLLSTIHRRGPSLSGCRCSYLEQFTPAHHFCTFVACLSVTPQDSSLHYFLSQSLITYSARTVTLSFWTLQSFMLLTYLHTYRHIP